MDPQPHFFVVRPGFKRQAEDGRREILQGPIVPLIAVDELPEWLDIVGVPRALAAEQTIGLYNLGDAVRPKGSYAVKIIHQVHPASSGTVKNTEPRAGPDAATAADPPRSHPSPHLASTSVPSSAAPASAPTFNLLIRPSGRMKSHRSESYVATNNINNNNTTAPSAAVHPPSIAASPTKQQPTTSIPLKQPQATTTATAGIATTAVTTAPDSRDPKDPADLREYCRHWCHHGTCKWGAHCRYLHAMPTTVAGLFEVGLHGCLPGWWVRLQHSRHPQGHSDQGLGLGQHNTAGHGTITGAMLRRAGYPLGPGYYGGGGAGGGGKKAQQVRETVMLLRELGVIGNNNNNKPLRRVRKVGGDGGRNVLGGEKEGALRTVAAAVDRSGGSVGAGAAGVGTVQVGGAEVQRAGRVEERVKGWEGGGQKAAAPAQKVVKLVDV